MNQLSSDQEIRGTRFNVPPETIKKQTKYMGGGQFQDIGHQTTKEIPKRQETR